MKKSQLKLVPEQLPSLFKTIKRSYSPSPSQIFERNMDALKTARMNTVNNDIIIPPLDFKRRVSMKCNTNTNELVSIQESEIRLTEAACATQRSMSYRIKKMDVSSVNTKNNKSIAKQQTTQKENTKVNQKAIENLNLNEFKEIADNKIATDRKSRRYPHCKIIRSKQIPFELNVHRGLISKKKDMFLGDLSMVSEISTTEQPFISIQSFNHLEF